MRLRVLAASAALCFCVAAAAYADCTTTPTNCTINANGVLHTDSGPNNRAGQIYSQTFTVSGMSGLVSGVKMTLGNWNLGTTFDSNAYPGNFFLELISPGGQAFDFWGEPNQACVSSTVTTFTITIQDGALLIPDGCSNPQGNTDGNYHISNNATYAPVVSAGPPGATPACSDPSGGHSGVKCPAQLSNATFATAFAGATPNGTWTIYSKDFSIDDNGNGIQNLSMTITTQTSETATTTTVSSNGQQAFTSSPNDSLTYTATVTSTGGTVNEGVVEFLDNGNAISGCSSATVSNGTATCTDTFSSGTPEGVHTITATYTDNASSPKFATSSTNSPVQVFLDNHTTSTSSNGTTTFCNPGTISLTNNGAVTTTQPYPQHLFVSGLSGSLASISLTLNNLTITGNNSFSGLDMLLVAPDGTSYVPLAEVGSVNAGGVSNLTFSIADSGATMMSNGTVSGSPNPSANTTYKPSDYNSSLSFFNAGSTTILDSPPASGYNLPPVKGTASLNATFASQNLNNASNPWSLYVADDTGVYTATMGGYCLAFTEGTSAASTTTVTANPNPATIPIGSTTTTVTLSAHVTSNGNAVTTGTVTFFSNGAQVGSPQNLDGSGNASVELQNAPEGAYAIGANYSGVQAHFTASQSQPYSLEIDDATVETDNLNGVANSYGYCNPATISLPGGDTLPLNYPSRVFITDAPGSLLKLGVTLNAVTFTQHYMEAMLVGPGGPTNNIIFWANIGSDPGSSLSNENFTIEDGASNGPLPSTGNISAGTFSPASYSGTSSILFTCTQTTCAQNSAPPPSQDWNYATTLGTTTFGSQFPAGNDPNGAFQFFIYHNVAGNGWSVGSHCVNITVTPPVAAVAVSPSPTATFTQGDAADTYTITVKNNGPGKTGTKEALTVVDTLPSGLHVVSMAETANSNGGGLADWTCDTSSVSCSRSTPMPANETDTITLTVSVDYSNHGTGFTNSVALSGGGIDTSNPANLTATDSTTIQPGPVSVTFDTSPAALSLSIGGTAHTAPYTASFTNYSTISSVSATSPQSVSTGTEETFASWSDAGAQTHDITLNCTSNTTTCTASYTATFNTSYLLATAVNDGTEGSVGVSQASPTGDGYYPSGTTLTLTATPKTGFGFVGWTGTSSSTTNPLSITMSGPMTYTATFAPLVNVTFSTSVAGLSYSVDGTPYTSSQTLSLTSTSQHTIATTATQGSNGTRYTFTSWSSGPTPSSASETITISTTTTSYTANFSTAYLLTTAANPTAGGSVGVSSTATPSSDGYYPASASVTLTATPNPGSTFLNWSGTTSGTTNPLNITMSAPMTYTANFGAFTVLGNSVAVTESGLLYSPLIANPGGGGSPGGGTSTFTVRNTSGSPITGPIQLVLTNLPSGVTAANATGTFNGNPFWTVPNSSTFATGASLTVVVQLNYAASTAVSTTPAAYSGSLQ